MTDVLYAALFVAIVVAVLAAGAMILELRHCDQKYKA
jgi:hypothetical protein